MRSSVRPLLTNSKELSDGPRVVAGRRGRDRGSSTLCSGYAAPCKHGSRPVFPVADDGREEPVFGAPEEMVAHDEQEDVKTPPCLPSLTSPHGQSIWTTASLITPSELGANIAWKGAAGSLAMITVVVTKMNVARR